MEWLNEYHLGGIAIGICTFLIIGLFPPHRGQGRILLGYTVLVDIFGTGHSRHYRDCAYQ